jgi:DNA (cytosine-5)-methyltransferase 1
MNAADLFAGAGGSALGLSRAGFRHEVLVEHGRDAAATLRAAVAAGLLDGRVVQADVSDLAAWRPRRSVDLLWASPPCQPFSTTGRRAGARDERDGWPLALAGIDAVRPRWFAGENVLGFIAHRKGCPGGRKNCPGCYAQRIEAALGRRFHHVTRLVLDAWDYGVPQKRLRVFLVAGPYPVEPPKTGKRRGADEAIEYDPWIRYEPVYSGYRESELARLPAAHRKELEEYGHDDWYCTVCDAYLSEGGCTCPGPLDSEDELSRPAPTLVGGSQRSHTAARSVVGADATRRERFLDALGRPTGGISVAEAAALQGFPPTWPFQGSNQSKYRQVANAVPPPLGEAVGRAIRGTS